MKYSPKYMAAARRRRDFLRRTRVCSSPQEIAVAEAWIRRALSQPDTVAAIRMAALEPVDFGSY